jgi:hypothetical protein
MRLQRQFTAVTRAVAITAMAMGCTLACAASSNQQLSADEASTEPAGEVDQYPGFSVPPPKPPKAVEPIEEVDHIPGTAVTPPKPPK